MILMREIRFRAWSEDIREMIQVSLLDIKEETIYYENGIKSLNREQELDFWWKPYVLIQYTGLKDKKKPYVLMQYTGLKDKNGVEIYEGDIVRYFRSELAVIVYRNGGVDIRSLSWGDREPIQRRLGEIEVIGNIYQNKDLLEG